MKLKRMNYYITQHQCVHLVLTILLMIPIYLIAEETLSSSSISLEDLIVNVDNVLYQIPYDCKTSSYDKSIAFCDEKNILGEQHKTCVKNIRDLIIEQQIKQCKEMLIKPWWYKFEKEIAAALWNGQIIKLPNAFLKPERFDLDTIIDDDNNNAIIEEELDDITLTSSSSSWKINKNNDKLDFTRYISNGKQVDAFLEELEQHKTFLNDILLTDFNISKKHFAASKYIKNAYLDYHNDHSYERVLSVVYHITKKWNTTTCGGELSWHGIHPNNGKHNNNTLMDMNETIIPIEYNALYLFIPRLYSGHRILKVICNDTKRYAISGWLTTPTPSKSNLLLRRIFSWKSKSHPFGSYHEFQPGDETELFF